MTEYAQSKSGLILPANLADRPACAVCFVCKAEFTRPQDLERHLHKCIGEHADELREVSPRKGPSDPANWDVEYERWVKGGVRPWQNWYDEHRIQRTD